MARHVQLRHLAFFATGTHPVSFDFHPGLNLIYSGSSNAANLIIEAVDFVLGAARKPTLARFGFNKVALSIEEGDGTLFTLERHLGGAAIRVYDGPPAQDIPAESVKTISPKHNPQAPDNISKLLLDKIGLGEALHWAEADETFKNLSFRSIAHYFVVNEHDIHKEASLIDTGQSAAPDFGLAIFNLLHGNYNPQAARLAETDTTLQLLRLARLQTLEGVIETAKRHLENSRRTAGISEHDNKAGCQPLDALIEELEDRMSALSWLTRRVDESSEPAVIETESPDERLCQGIAHLLSDWHMPNAAMIGFDPVTRDFILAETPRGGLSKLGRGVVHAAFKIALLRLALQQKLPHAGFVLLHSPFLESRVRDFDDEADKAIMQSQFYETLSELQSGQIIVVQRGSTIEGLTGRGQRADFVEKRN